MTATATGSAAADDPLARRFAVALARLNPGGGRIGLAVSGGADSLAMLLLAQRTIAGGFEVATVDHALRAEAVAECALVSDLCSARQVPCAVLRVEVGSGNLQDQARSARYAALAAWAKARDLEALATAHHADDQAETLIMRLNRASGLAGLAGVRERSMAPGSEVPLIRPLLTVRRAELEAVVAEAGLTPVRDRSNEDQRFDRVRVRQAMAGSDLIDPAAVALSAAFLAEAEEALDWTARREWAEQVTQADRAIRYRPLAPRAVVLRVVERAVRQLGGQPRGQGAAALTDALLAGQGGNVGGVLARVEGGAWVFRPEPPRR